MSKIALFLGEGFEEIEALTVVDVCRRAGLELKTASVSDARQVKGSHDIEVLADGLIGDVDFDAIDMIVLPGGMPGTTNLEACKTLTTQVEAFLKNGKYVAAICAAPGILGRMGLLKGRKAVSFPSVEGELKGADIPQTETCTDDRLITSRGMGTAIPFALSIVETLCGKEKKDALAKEIVYEVYR